MSIYGWKYAGGTGKNIGNDLDPKRNRALVSGEFDYFSFFAYFSVYPARPSGEYRFKSVRKAVLDIDASSKGTGYELIIREFTSPDDVQELYNLIRAGKIWPHICYNDTQVPAPCRHLKGLWREAIGILRREVARKLHFR